MCGIIGYLGDREATPILMESLKRLEYRGYDSAGVAVLELPKVGHANRTSITKSEAKVDTLIEKLEANMPSGKLGIGHTRWSTDSAKASTTSRRTSRRSFPTPSACSCWVKARSLL